MTKQLQAVDSKNGTQVSLIVPTLRRPEFLYRCLRSLALQRSHPTEVLVGVRAEDDFNHRCEGLFQIQLGYLKRIFSQKIRVTADQSLITFTAYLPQ
jgi:hypothetical protein